MPRLEELVAFCKVIEHKSFSRAAKTLGLSQPAVSLQVKSLEAEYGIKLLHREGFEIVPTENGHTVYDFASQIIHLYEESRQRIQELGREVEGSLVIGASTGLGEYLLPLVLGRFKARNSQVNAMLRIGDSNQVLDQIIRHQLELGFVGVSRRDRHLRFEAFVHDHLILVVPSKHPLVTRHSIPYEEFLKLPLILQQHGSGATEVLYQILSEHGLDPSQLNIFMEAGLQESTKSAVKAGLGSTIISRLGIIEELREGTLIEIPVEGLEMERDFYAVYRRTSPLTNLAQSFLEYAHQETNKIMRQGDMQNL